VRLAIPLLLVRRHVERDVDEVPSSGLRAGVARVVGPARDRSERAALEESCDRPGGGLGEARLRHLRDDRVTFLAPGEGVPREYADCERADSERADSERADSERADSERADSERADSERADSERADSGRTGERGG